MVWCVPYPDGRVIHACVVIIPACGYQDGIWGKCDDMQRLCSQWDLGSVAVKVGSVVVRCAFHDRSIPICILVALSWIPHGHGMSLHGRLLWYTLHTAVPHRR